MSDLDRAIEQFPGMSEDVRRLNFPPETPPNAQNTGVRGDRGTSGRGKQVNALKISESDYQQTIIDYAHLKGWLVAHFRPGLTQSGHWKTAVQGDAGFPDLTLVRNGTILLIEVKSDSGKLSDHQKAWLNAGKGNIYVARPINWEAIRLLLE